MAAEGEAQAPDSPGFPTLVGGDPQVYLADSYVITLGFGPFTFLDHHLLPGAVGLRVHRSLQGFAGRRIPMLRSIGSQYIVLARKRRGASARPGLVWNTSRQSAARIPVT